jgi:phospholipid/cholesterol/gamma-HCH transport system ATP-binding protein
VSEALPEALPAALIEFRDVHKAFGEKQVLCGVDLEVRRGEVLFIIGTSGVGKSVTIKHLVGLLRIDAGEIHFDGERIDQLSEKQFYAVRRRVAMVFQSSTLFDSMTLQENVALPLRKLRRLRHPEAMERASELLDLVRMRDHQERYPAGLSDGMRKRAAIARALGVDPEVVLFDEPTTGLAPVSARRVDQLIRRLADEEQKTCVVVSHDLESILSIADRIALIYQGRVHHNGPVDDFRASDDPVIDQFMAGRSDGPMETPGF